MSGRLAGNRYEADHSYSDDCDLHRRAMLGRRTAVSFVDFPKLIG
jgi:hypothetical protein